jgi:hypothetical protein
MQKVHRLFLTLTVFIGLGLSTYAQTACVPDATTPEIPALYPDTLPNGTVGQAYSQIVTLVIPRDSVVDVPPFGSLTIDICSIKLDSVPNLPAGMSYECNTEDCNWVVEHDTNLVKVNRGCVILSGIPEDNVKNPFDTLTVYVTIEPGAYDAVTDSCMPLQITLPPELTSIEYRTVLSLLDTVNTAIEDYAFEVFEVQLYPNPSNGSSRLSYFLPEKADIDIRLTDMLGRMVEQVQVGTRPAGRYEHTIGRAGLPKGIYFVAIELDQGKQVLSRKMIVR